jgi:hypothetical protein
VPTGGIRNKNLKTSKGDPVVMEINIKDLDNLKYRIDDIMPGQR